METPKVLVGCPTSFHKEYCLKEFIRGLQSLTYKNKDILIIENSKDNTYFNKLKKYGLSIIKGQCLEDPIPTISASRNILIDKAIKGNYDYLFLLDQDVIPPENAIELLISHKKQAVCGVYFNHIQYPDGKIILSPGVFKIVENAKDNNDLPSVEPLTEEEIFSNRLIRIGTCGGGALLLNKQTIRKAGFRTDVKRFEDRQFCADLYKNKIPLYCDTRVICKHFIKNRPYVWKDGQLVKSDKLIKSEDLKP